MPLTLGATAWGDYDNDGKLDLLVVGNGGSTKGPQTQLWKNMGNGTLSTNSSSSLGIPGLTKASVAWGDYNNDGRLDILVAGLTSALVPICQVWRNQGNGTFVNSGIDLPGIHSGSVAWGDFNNDGELDLVISGFDVSAMPVTEVWQNLGNGHFLRADVAMIGVSFGSIALGDFDHDGYLDILSTGSSVSGVPTTQIWRNLGGFVFSNITVAIPGVTRSSVALGDYDGDSYADILVSGMDASANAQTQIWRNQGNLTFSNLNLALPKVYLGTVAWGDFDNDGKLDILITGNSICQVWKNMGGGAFANANAGLTALSSCMAACGDFDNSGKLGIVTFGVSGSTGAAKLYRNSVTTSNSPPAAPTGLAADLASTATVFTWNAATDDATPAAGLSYNLRIGSTPGGLDVVAPNSDSQTGYRRLAQTGNAGEVTGAILALPPGVYYWSVQAVDSGFAGSPFAAESSFVLSALVATLPASDVTYNSAYLNGQVNPRGVATTAWFEWGVSTAYGNALPAQDVGSSDAEIAFKQALFPLQSGTTYHYRVVARDAFGTAHGSDLSFTTPTLSLPTLSEFANVTTTLDTATPAIPFTVSSATVPLGSLVVTAWALDSGLVPAANLVLGGSGANRTLMITPTAGKLGTTVITVSVFDGISTTSKSFLFTVASASSFPGLVSAGGGFSVGSAIGLTTNLDVLVPGPRTNTLQFTGGILTGVVPK